MTDTPSTPPGWYPDPHQAGGLRWWDGTRWTEHTAQPPTTAQGAQAVSAQPAPFDQQLSAPKNRGRGWLVVAVLAVIALVAGGAVYVTQDDDDNATETEGDTSDEASDDTSDDSSDDIDESTTTLGATTTSTTIPGGAGGIRTVVFSVEPTDGLSDRFEFGENDKGISAIEIVKDQASGGITFSVERPGNPNVQVNPIDGGFVIAEPDLGEVTVLLVGQQLTVSWSTVEGEEGSLVQDLTPEQVAALGPPPTAIFGRRPSSPSAFQVPTGLSEAPTTPYSIANVARITSTWDPATANVRVLPDRSFCANLPVTPPSGIDVGSVTCSGSWAPPVTTLLFHAQVTAHNLRVEDLNSADAALIRTNCEARLNQYSGVVGFAEFVVGVAGVIASVAPTTAIPARVAAALGGVGFGLDALGRVLSPSEVANTCARELQVRLLDQQSAAFVRTLAFDVPLVVTPIDPTFEVVEQSGPVPVQPFPAGGTGIVGGGHTFRLSQNVGSGDFQAKLTWTGDSDMDLHVIDPNGEEISFSSTSSSSGGALDRDEIPGCGVDSGFHAENIFWPVGGAPSGTYQVFVEHYTSCDGQAHTATLESFVLGMSQGAQTFTIAPDGRSEPISVVVP